MVFNKTRSKKIIKKTKRRFRKAIMNIPMQLGLDKRVGVRL